MSGAIKLRPEQANALGGCAECAFEPVKKDPSVNPNGDGPPPKSVVVVDPSLIDTYIAITLVDTARKPVPFARYIITPPGMKPVEGTLDANGKTRIEGINPGTCTVTFPVIDRRDFV
jgi:hypothetical protein